MGEDEFAKTGTPRRERRLRFIRAWACCAARHPGGSHGWGKSDWTLGQYRRSFSRSCFESLAVATLLDVS
jgi:hypothetical protein